MNYLKFLFRTDKQITFVFAFVLTVALFIGVQAAPGDLDPTFGNSGKVITPAPPTDAQVRAVAVQPDGKIIAGGFNLSGSISFVLVRYNPDGTLDNTFGTNGKVITQIGIQAFLYAIAFQPDGKIVAAGVSYMTLVGDFVIARYNANGSLDTTFGVGGKVVTDFNGGEDAIKAIKLQSDGKIVVAGYSRAGSNSIFDFALARYNSDGTLDSEFGSGGKVLTDIGTNSNDRGEAVIIQQDGKIIVAGSSVAGGVGGTALVKYKINGSLDDSFGNGGKFIIEGFGTLETDTALQTSGKIVLTGSFQDVSSSRTVLVRVNPNGSLDGAFGDNGIVLTSLNATPKEIAIQSNGKIVVVGSGRIGTTSTDFVVARFNSNGSVDSTFGANGVVTTDFNGCSCADVANATAIQPDGKIIAAGYASNSSQFNFFALARYLGDTINRPTQFDFDGDSKADVSIFRPSNGAWYLLNSTAGFSAAIFGISIDKIAPADYDGDGKTDLAVYRDGTWYLQRSALGFTGVGFGAATDAPVPADFDGDGKSELAVFRPSNGGWYIYNLATNQASSFAFGTSGDVPVPADYDGDAKADIAVFRSGVWYIQRSQLGFTGIGFGVSSDKPVPADYDGDGKTDVAVFRPESGAWYLLQSTAGFAAISFGVSTDKPAAADYDGDGKADVAVFRDGVWYLNRTTAGFTGIGFGAAGDKPIPNAFVP
jgi:uncharacterized delta-60 repeat protein